MMSWKVNEVNSHGNLDYDINANDVLEYGKEKKRGEKLRMGWRHRDMSRRYQNEKCFPASIELPVSCSLQFNINIISTKSHHNLKSNSINYYLTDGCICKVHLWNVIIEAVMTHHVSISTRTSPIPTFLIDTSLYLKTRHDSGQIYSSERINKLVMNAQGGIGIGESSLDVTVPGRNS
jgi:hypothetical protein